MIQRIVNTPYGAQLETYLRGIAADRAITLHIQVYLIGEPPAALQSQVLIREDLNQAQQTILDNAIAAFRPDTGPDDTRAELRVGIRRLMTVDARWGLLSPAQKDDAIHDLLHFLLVKTLHDVGEQL